MKMQAVYQKVALSVIALTVVCGRVSAHQDTPLELKEGVLIGLPKVFQPAAFDRDKKVLTIGGKQLELSPVLKRLFPDNREVDFFGKTDKKDSIPYDLSFSASWYHGPSTLPPYLQIRITPKERNFRFEILVDIQALRILEAEMIVSLSPNSEQSIPIAINGSERAIPVDLTWQSIIGTWRSGSILLTITSNTIAVTDDGKALDYPAGSISPIEPGVLSLKLPGGSTEKVFYRRSGDILEIGFRAGISLAKLGSDTDKFYERLEQAEQGGADQPATAPELKSEGKDKPQPESKVRPR
jgi:hypothetical protein